MTRVNNDGCGTPVGAVFTTVYSINGLYRIHLVFAQRKSTQIIVNLSKTVTADSNVSSDE